MNLFREESSSPRYNAQRNLQGRTHYVDEETLRFHKSRILSARASQDGLLFYIIESVALDMNNTKRGFRYVIFNIFGEAISRPDLEHCFKSKDAAIKAMWVVLNALDAKKHTLEAIKAQGKSYLSRMQNLREKVKKIGE